MKKQAYNARPILIDTKYFNTSSAAKRYIRYIVNEEKLNKPVSQKNKNFIHAILDYHPNVKEKIGCGIDYIFVRYNPDYPNKEFCIKRIDGSIEHFSWHWCVDAKPEECE